MLLRELQDMLARLYGLDLEADVRDYLVTDSRLLECIPADGHVPASETLFVHEDGDELGLTLYLNEELLERLLSANPCDSLSFGNLDDFCKVLEGVSHFVYLAWNALNDKSVTRLELELQAEVDKYVSSRLLVESQDDTSLASQHLKHHLFDRVRYLDELDESERARYEHANDTVRRYCHSLEQRFSAQRVCAAMLTELRAFYRMTQPDKFSHLNAVQFT